MKKRSSVNAIAKMADLVIRSLTNCEEVSFGRPAGTSKINDDRLHLWECSHGVFRPLLPLSSCIYFATIQHIIDALDVPDGLIEELIQSIVTNREDEPHQGPEPSRSGVYHSTCGWSVGVRIRFESDNTVRLTHFSEGTPRRSAAGEVGRHAA